MRTLWVSLLILTSLFSSAQGNFIINGKIELLSKSKTIILSSSFGEFIGNINPDGTFVINGNIKEPCIALIKTDSSSSNGLWLEPGNYEVLFKEIKLNKNNTRPHFRIPALKGPQDAEVYYGFMEPQYYINGSRDEMKKQLTDFVVKYLDSVVNKVPKSKVIPEIVNRSRTAIGDEATQIYMSLLSDDQIKQDGFKMLECYFKRKEKIEKEIYFQDFKMKDQNGNTFKLSSLNKKLILLDFWSSDCAACRRKHPRIAELYKNYSDKGFEIISVSLDDNYEDWKKAISKDKMIWINVSDLKGWNTSLAENYFIKSIPFSIWLDKDKKIISINDLSDNEIDNYFK